MTSSNHKRFGPRLTTLTLAIVMFLGFCAARPVYAATAEQISTRDIILASVTLVTAVAKHHGDGD